MRNDLLFIDGELVDLDDNTKITLNFKSNIFTDLSKIVSNNSYTIKLPKTVRNQRIIQHADLPACETDYPRKRHAGRYIRNGIEIISKSSAVLLSISDSIEMALAWGNATAFSSIVSDGKKLTDLPYLEGGRAYAGRDYREWKDWGANDKLYPNINYGFKTEETKVWYHPVVYVNEIFDMIASASGVSFVFSDDKKAQMQNMFVPLLTRNDSKEYSDMCAITFVANSVAFDETVNRYMITFEQNLTSNYYGCADSLGSNKTNTYCSFISNGTPRMTGHIELIVQADKTPSSPTLVVYNSNQSNNGANIDTTTVLEISSVDVSLVSGTTNQYSILFDFEDEKTSVLTNIYDNTKGKYIKFSFDNIGDGGKIVTVSGNIKVANIAEQVILETRTGSGYVDGWFWIVPNLPNIKQIDFIKAVASMLGVFAVAEDENVIRFVSVETLVENRSKALNWTRKVVATFQENKPKEISFSLDDFAQKNNYSWKEDSTVPGDYSGYIVVDDETLDYENDVITLPFSPTEMYKGIAKIPLYSYDTGGKIQYSTVEPRLLLLSGVNGVFTGLDWKTLLKKNYSKYQELVRKPVILTEKIEVSDIDLKELDMTVPVYLGQYGRYYAIISIKAEDTGICECKLLQLEV